MLDSRTRGQTHTRVKIVIVRVASGGFWQFRVRFQGRSRAQTAKCYISSNNTVAIRQSIFPANPLCRTRARFPQSFRYGNPTLRGFLNPREILSGRHRRAIYKAETEDIVITLCKTRTFKDYTISRRNFIFSLIHMPDSESFVLADNRYIR